MKFYPGSLALGGGGLKGAAHVGVLKVFEEEGFPIDSIAGTSAGSIVGAAYAMGYPLDELVDIIKELSTGKVLDFSIKPMATMGIIVRLVLNMLKWGKHDTQLGLIRGQQLQEYLQRLFGKRTFEGLRFPLIVTAVNLQTGRLVVFTSQAQADKLKGVRNLDVYTDVDLATAVRASTAIPGIFTPLYYRGMVLVDGGVKTVVPVDLLYKAGSRKIIGVDLGDHPSDVELDNLLAVILQTVDVMTEDLKNMLIDQYADFVIQPRFGEIQLTDFAKLEQIYRSGYQTTRDRVPLLRTLFERRPPVNHHIQKTTLSTVN